MLPIFCCFLISFPSSSLSSTQPSSPIFISSPRPLAFRPLINPRPPPLSLSPHNLHAFSLYFSYSLCLLFCFQFTTFPFPSVHDSLNIFTSAPSAVCLLHTLSLHLLCPLHFLVVHHLPLINYIVVFLVFVFSLSIIFYFPVSIPSPPARSTTTSSFFFSFSPLLLFLFHSPPLPPFSFQPSISRPSSPHSFFSLPILPSSSSSSLRCFLFSPSLPLRCFLPFSSFCWGLSRLKTSPPVP